MNQFMRKTRTKNLTSQLGKSPTGIESCHISSADIIKSALSSRSCQSPCICLHERKMHIVRAVFISSSECACSFFFQTREHAPFLNYLQQLASIDHFQPVVVVVLLLTCVYIALAWWDVQTFFGVTTRFANVVCDRVNKD